MRRYFFLLLLLPMYTFAQTDTLTQLDKFISSTPGAMIRKENIDIGKFKNGIVKIYKLTNLRTNSKLNYVVIDYDGSFASTLPGNVKISMDELPGIIDAIEYMSKVSLKGTPENNEEYYYTTPDNLRLYLINGTFMSKGWYIGLGHQYYYSSSFRTGQHIMIRQASLMK